MLSNLGMVRKRTIKRLLLLICLVATGLITLSISITIDQQIAEIITINRQDRERWIKKHVHDNFKSEKNETMFAYYRLSADERYHYEVRFELNAPGKNDDYRLMIILCGDKRACSDRIIHKEEVNSKGSCITFILLSTLISEQSSYVGFFR